jgi:hypothetical protein
MAMSFTFSDAEFDQVIAEWAAVRDLLDDKQPAAHAQLEIWADLPPAPDPASQSFMTNVRGALQAATGFGAAARLYVNDFHDKLVSAKRDYLESDEDGVRRFRITLGEAEQA